MFSNYLQLFEADADASEADLEFSPVYFIKKTRIENPEGIAKLIISLLNSVSFWYNICILDFHSLFTSPLYLFTLLPVWRRQKLLKLKLYLRKKLDRYGNLKVVPLSLCGQLKLLSNRRRRRVNERRKSTEVDGN